MATNVDICDRVTILMKGSVRKDYAYYFLLSPLKRSETFGQNVPLNFKLRHLSLHLISAHSHLEKANYKN
jgi:hypothetical protein